MKPCIFSGLVFILLTTGCYPSFKIFDTTSDSVIEYENNYYVYKNAHLELHYTFWAESVDPLMELLNTTDSTIYLHLGQSTFDLASHKSEMSYADYAYLEVTTYGTDTLIYIPSFFQKNTDFIIAVPPNCWASVIGTYTPLSWGAFKLQDRSEKYTRENSPLKIKNRLCYSFDPKKEMMECFENAFWAERIALIQYKDYKNLYGKTEPENIPVDRFYISNMIESESTVNALVDLLDILME